MIELAERVVNLQRNIDELWTLIRFSAVIIGGCLIGASFIWALTRWFVDE